MILKRINDKYNVIKFLKDAHPDIMDMDACEELLDEIQGLLDYVSGYELTDKPNEAVLSYVDYKLKGFANDRGRES